MDSSKKVDLKIIIIGALGVGKTSLLHQYVHKTFYEDYRTTLGASILTKVIAVDNTPLKLQVSEEIASAWCKEKHIPYFEVSAKNDINVAQAFETLAKQALTTVVWESSCFPQPCRRKAANAPCRCAATPELTAAGRAPVSPPPAAATRAGRAPGGFPSSSIPPGSSSGVVLWLQQPRDARGRSGKPPARKTGRLNGVALRQAGCWQERPEVLGW
uniref:RAB7B, member RAS oncogene family n=1 Tax=Apteryx owenii TaxID=8824 RepID=A0A8B9PRF7_APTOW